MKRLLSFGAFLFLALFMQAQNTVTVSGLVTNQASGAPVANWTVYAVAGDSLVHFFGVGETNASGQYTISIDGMGTPINFVQVFTEGMCDPQTPGGVITQYPSIVNGVAEANFSICPAQVPDCYVFAEYYPGNGLSVQFISNYLALDGSVAASYLWDFGDGNTSTEANPSHTYAEEGFYNVTLTATGTNGCSNSFSISIVVFNFSGCWASADIQPGSDSLTYNFTAYYGSYDSSAVAVSYLWNFGDGTSSTEANPSHTYAQPGFYIGSLTIVGSDGCTATMEFAFSTDFDPAPDCLAYIDYQQTATTTFNFQAYAYNYNQDTTTVISYLWDFGDGNTSTEASPTHTYAGEGIYNILLTLVTGPDSCEAHACSVVFAYDSPLDTFLYGCQALFSLNYTGDPNSPAGGNPLTIEFVDLSMGVVQSWHWDFGDGDSSNVQNPTHTYAEEGLYSVSLSIVTLDGCESSISFEIYVGDTAPWEPEFDCQALFIPFPDSIGSNTIQFLDLSFSPNPIQSWSWNFGDGASSSEQNPLHTYSQPGEYTVSLTITADSCNSIIEFTVDTEEPWNFFREPAQFGRAGGVSATQQPDIFRDLKVFPNPATENIHLTYYVADGADYQLRITDLRGKTLSVSAQQAQSGVNIEKVDISALAPGIYLMELRHASGVRTAKFVKQ